ncbi:MAG: argininosuccinate lyase [Myxococcota bacterium]
MSVLWAKDGVDIDAEIQAFLAGEDVLHDRELLAYDVRATRAHVRGLANIGVFTKQEVSRLDGALDRLEERWRSGEFVLDARFEDMHSAIEFALTEELGELGRKVHTGRSRNDQVLVATRLYLKDALDVAKERCVAIAEGALKRAEADADVAMPGYTHLQRAVPSSLGMWFACWVESFIDNAVLLTQARDLIDANPLGTAAGYGVNVALDRAYTTQELGFGRLQINPIYAQNTRGKFSLHVLHALGQAMLDVRRLSWDLSLFTTAEFAFVRLPARYTTGSSIMPNKKNPDVVELLRAACAVVSGARSELEHVLALPSGYHRDLQGTKGPMLRGVKHALASLALVPGVLDALEFDEGVMLEAIGPHLHATDRAVELALEGVPFRDAYRRVGDSLGDLAHREASASLGARTSPGAAADLMLDVLSERLAAARAR